MDNDNKNYIAFVAVAFVLLLAYTSYSYFFVEPVARQAAAARAKAVAAAQVAQTAVTAKPQLTHDQALAVTPRVIIETPALSGSMSLKGARFDDLFLNGYHTEVAKTSPRIELLRPEGMADAYFAE
jgi:YidC/Oxa1 family membrane protein insertase